MMIPYSKHSEIFHKYVFIKENNNTTNNITFGKPFGREKILICICQSLSLLSLIRVNY